MTLRDRFYALPWEQQQAVRRGLRVLATFGLCALGFGLFVWAMVRAYQ